VAAGAGWTIVPRGVAAVAVGERGRLMALGLGTIPVRTVLAGPAAIPAPLRRREAALDEDGSLVGGEDEGRATVGAVDLFVAMVFHGSFRGPGAFAGAVRAGRERGEEPVRGDDRRP
jgi:hypothetical protein